MKKDEYSPLGWKDLLLILLNFIGSVGLVVLIYVLLTAIIGWIFP